MNENITLIHTTEQQNIFDLAERESVFYSFTLVCKRKFLMKNSFHCVESERLFNITFLPNQREF